MAKQAKEPCCISCGVPWIKHLGTIHVCAELIKVRAENLELKKNFGYALLTINLLRGNPKPQRKRK